MWAELLKRRSLSEEASQEMRMQMRVSVACGQRFYYEYWIMQAVIYVWQRNNQDLPYINIFLLSHKANNTCISLKRYLSLACMCSILSILALKGFLECAPHCI